MWGSRRLDVCSAGISAAGDRIGTPRRLRRSAASYIERDDPGHGKRFLGHRTAGIAEAYYLDLAIANGNQVRPPDLRTSLRRKDEGGDWRREARRSVAAAEGTRHNERARTAG